MTFLNSQWGLYTTSLITPEATSPWVFLRKDFLKYGANLPEHSHAVEWFQVALQLYWNHILTWVFSCKFAASFQTPRQRHWTNFTLSLMLWLLNLIMGMFAGEVPKSSTKYSTRKHRETTCTEIERQSIVFW